MRRALTAALLTVALLLAGLEAASRLRLLPCFVHQPGVWEHHPSFGWFHRPAVQGWGQGCLGRDVEWRATVAINEHGLRDVEHAYAKSEGVFRILILGDSFIEGFNVDFEHHFLARLQKKLAALSPKIEVMAAAVSAWGTDQELLYFLHEGVKYSPDLVVLAFNPGNDVVENVPGLGLPKPRVAKKPSFTLAGGRLTIRDYPVQIEERDDGWLATADDVLARHTHVYPMLRYLTDKVRRTISPPPPVRKRRGAAQTSAATRPVGSGLGSTLGLVVPGARVADAADPSGPASTPAEVRAPPSPQQGGKRGRGGDTRGEVPADVAFALDPLLPKWEAAWQLTQALVLDLQKRVTASGAAFAAAIVPSKFAVGGPRVNLSFGWERSDIDPTVPERRTEEFFVAQRIPVCSLLPRFRANLEATGRNGFFAFDIHWNEDGHRIVADALAECLAPMIPERLAPRS